MLTYAELMEYAQGLLKVSGASSADSRHRLEVFLSQLRLPTDAADAAAGADCEEKDDDAIGPIKGLHSISNLAIDDASKLRMFLMLELVRMQGTTTPKKKISLPKSPMRKRSLTYLQLLENLLREAYADDFDKMIELYREVHVGYFGMCRHLVDAFTVLSLESGRACDVGQLKQWCDEIKSSCSTGDNEVMTQAVFDSIASHARYADRKPVEEGVFQEHKALGVMMTELSLHFSHPSMLVRELEVAVIRLETAVELMEKNQREWTCNKAQFLVPNEDGAGLKENACCIDNHPDSLVVASTKLASAVLKSRNLLTKVYDILPSSFNLTFFGSGGERIPKDKAITAGIGLDQATMRIDAYSDILAQVRGAVAGAGGR
jgi:hypothetical protein